jgi:glycosyltransferase involved in cell wall biosynthesis
MPKLIAVTGYYNRTDKLHESIYSVLKQGYEDFKYVVFDDASTDQTSYELEKIKHPKYDLILHDQNKGFVRGLIEAIHETDSEYIAIHGSGDISLQDRFRKQVEFLDKNPDVALVGCAYENCYKDNKSVKIPKRKLYNNKDIKKGNPFTHGEVIFRRNIYESVGGYYEIFKYSQDYDLWLRMSRQTPLGAINDVLYRRFIQMDGVSYDPEKLIRQKKFSLLARKLNNGTIDRDSFPSVENFEIDDFISEWNLQIIKKKILMGSVLMKHGEVKKALYLLKSILNL